MKVAVPVDKWCDAEMRWVEAEATPRAGHGATRAWGAQR
jgi:hypothetical protein